MGTLYAIGAGGDWTNAATWDDTSSGGAGGDGPPGSGDDVILDAGSGNVTLDANSADIGSLDMSNYGATLALGANTLDVDGNAALDGTITGTGPLECSGDLDASGIGTLPNDCALTHNGTGDVDCNITGGALEIEAGAGTSTLIEELGCYSLTITSGTFAAGANDMTIGAGGFTLTNATGVTGSGALDVGGSITYVAGTMTAAGYTGTLTQTGSGNISWASYANRIGHLSLGGTGVTSTITGTTMCKKFTHGAGTVDGTGKQLSVYAAANDWWTPGAGTVTVATLYLAFEAATLTQAGLITVTASTLVQFLSISANRVTTLTAGLAAGASNVRIEGGTNGTSMEVILGGPLTCGDINLGAAGEADQEGKIDFGDGNHTVTGDIKRTATASATSVIDFGDAGTIVLGGTIDGTGITATSGGRRVRGGTIQHITVTGVDLIAYGSTDGGSTSGVSFRTREGGTGTPPATVTRCRH